MSAASSRIATALATILALGIAVVVLGRSATAPPRLGADDEGIAIDLGGARFHAELAVDFATQVRGLGGRERIDPEGGMLFAYPDAKPLVFVMRDCLAPIDIAFLDADARVVSMHTMTVETPKQPWESPRDYQARLQPYASGAPAQFAFETAAGRLAALGVRVGDRARFDLAGLRSKLGGIGR